jgi:exodeoxyribonuclease VII large subunit
VPHDEQSPTLLSLRTGRGSAAKSRRGEPQRGLFSGTLFEPLQPAVSIVGIVDQMVREPDSGGAPPASEPSSPGPRERSGTYSVRELIAELRQHVEHGYSGLVSVEGEISNCRPAASGHLYFTLKDGDAQLPVVLFRNQARLSAFKPQDGVAVEVRGRISVYESRGQLQLIGEFLQPRGTGALQLAFDQLKERLRREGLFDRPRKVLPPFPRCIGVVTSPNGAALYDILQVVGRRHARLNILIYPAAMQGARCAATVAAGVKWFNQKPDRVDLILVARGGGSFEDLNGFNHELLARAIAASALPVVSGIGHEVDSTIADFVADLRASTPSAAAELITAAQHRIEERVLALDRRVHRAGQFNLIQTRRRLERLSAEHVLARVRNNILLRAQRVDDLRERVDRAQERRFAMLSARLGTLEARLRRHDPTLRMVLAQRRLSSAQQRLQRVQRELVGRPRVRLERGSGRLQALSPLAVLSRGYAIVYAADGSILRSADAVATGQEIRARLASGAVRARVLEKETA